MRFEIRIPTYRRPDMLRRALQSLQAQTFHDWQAVVLDDSEKKEGELVVKELRDERIHYSPNSARLGAAKNIDQCFSPEAQYLGEFGCLLEDDNYWLPDFLDLINQRLRNTSQRLLLANQRIHREGDGLLPSNKTTRGEWFADGELPLLQLQSSLLLMEGVSNGGLVWRLGAEGVDLRVGSSVEQTALHEACRTLLIAESLVFVSEAQAVWTDMPVSNTARASEQNRVVGRGMQSIRDFILESQGEALVRAAMEHANRLNLIPILAANLAYSGCLSDASRLGTSAKNIWKLWCKGHAVRFIQADPCREFLCERKKRSV